ncbi:MAG: TatD family hydrolase [Candidatus Thorarchaeota archaeon]|jgi:TatD DNase family protein
MNPSIRYIDSHCHIEQKEFDSDRDAIIKHAMEEGIALISSAITPDTWQSLLDISSRFPNVYASIGLDPMMHNDIENALSKIRVNSENIVSIGEVGLDHYRERDHDQRDAQESAFTKMINQARELTIPIQVHSRSAGRAALDVLRKNDAELVHMHAFDGRSSLAKTASNELGYYFSIPTSVVRSPQKQKLVKSINLERLLIETDSPVLAPKRGERNTPLNLPIVLQEVSRILRRNEEELQNIVLENTRRLYSRIQI